MRGMFSIVGLLVVVAIIGVLAKPAVVDGTVLPAPDPALTPQQQTQQIRQALEAATQARPVPDEK
jgi:hypothetical protein